MERKLKDSGIPWIGAIPEHWESTQLRKFLTLFSEKGHQDKPLLSVTRENGVIVRNVESAEENHNYIPEDLSGYKLVKSGQFAINKMKAWQGSYGVSAYEGIVSPAYYVCDLNFENKEFFSWAIRSKAYVPFFTQMSKGIRVDQWDLSITALKSIPFFVPPVAEQEAISAYLDEKCGEIDELIEVEQQMIADLESYRQSVITEAVTHGLNPNAPLRPSGIDWLGQIPIHWEMKQLRAFFSEVTLQNSNTAITEQLQFKFGTIIPKPEAVIDSDLLNTISKYTVVRPGDIIINGLNLNYDFVSFRVGKVNQIGVITSAYIALRPNVGILPKFYEYFLKGMDAKKVFHSFGTGIRCTLTFKELKRKYIPFVPYKEQEAIADYLDAKCAEIAELIKVKQDKIEALRQYRQSLIFEAVTGKINIA